MGKADWTRDWRLTLMGKADWTRYRGLTFLEKADWSRGGCLTCMGRVPSSVSTPAPTDWTRGRPLGSRWLVMGQPHLLFQRLCR